jgi:transposase
MPTLPSYIERQLDLIEALGAGIEAAHRELTWLAKQSEVASRLRTVPGIGILTSLAFVAVVDDIRRFQDAHRLESYVGLTPGEHSSGERQRRTSINKAGSSLLRFLLIEGAWRIYRLCPQHQMVLWAKEIEKRRGRNIAIVALARKVTGILFAIWRDGSSYRQ